jgi:predicted nuclease of predicted toxin-antitoxin system
MSKYLVDANLPFKISVWQAKEYEFVVNINDEWSDSEIWDYAKANDLTIITKDADFSHRIMFSAPPPKIVHIKIGNMKLKDFEAFIVKVWAEVELLVPEFKLINVFSDRIESIK